MINIYKEFIKFIIVIYAHYKEFSPLLYFLYFLFSCFYIVCTTKMISEIKKQYITFYIMISMSSSNLIFISHLVSLDKVRLVWSSLKIPQRFIRRSQEDLLTLSTFLIISISPTCASSIHTLLMIHCCFTYSHATLQAQTSHLITIHMPVHCLLAC